MTMPLELMTWFSPGFPVGAFAYSHGLEWAVQDGTVHDAASFQDWLCQVLTHGSGRNDAILLAAAWAADTDDALRGIDDLARALASANVYIANAVIATYGEQVVDSFYVKDMFGLKYHSKSKQKSLEAKLRQAIAEGAERAGT